MAKATTKAKNEIAEANFTEDTRYSPNEVGNKIVELLIDTNKNGETLIAGIVEDDSILNNNKFVKAAMTFIESVAHNNSYDAISSLTEICTNKRYSNGLDEIVEYLIYKNNDFAYWMKSCDFTTWHFDDALLNKLWSLEDFNRRAAVTIFGIVSYLTDMTFPITITGYFGDRAYLSVIAENLSVFFKSWDN